ncbi:diguanylate cyclase [Cellulomonas endophytica]|uniref:diguanylate cyclase n=1 Tax=Cellulomonas endophytica TaxID=2494735 RepID=UPI0013E97EF6|nr:diguanylate cyclase [Cellulomonas endophytica]
MAGRARRGTAAAVAEGSPVSQLACDDAGRVVWCNAAARSLVGVGPGAPLADALVAVDGRTPPWPSGHPDPGGGAASWTARTVGGAVVEVHVARHAGRTVVAVVDVSVLHAAVAGTSVDGLTGLPHRMAVTEAAITHRRQALATGTRPALVLVDLDRFKEVNDRFGHAAGDAVLREVARRLAGCAGPDAVVGRTGGDEFLVAVPDGGAARALEVARDVAAALAAPVGLEVAGGTQVVVPASMGIAEHSATTDFDQWLDEADAALDRAKRTGRGRAVVYEPTEGSPVDVRRLEQQVARLQRRADRDDRTGLLRDLVFREDHLRLLREVHAGGGPLSLVLVDVDEFHGYNVAHGLQEGNAALRAVADRCREAVGDDDRAYRYGGDEFALLLPGADVAAALAVAERVRAAVEGDGIEHRASSWGVVTVSVGVCTVGGDPAGTRDVPDPDRLVGQASAMLHGANRALLEVKDAGRNLCRSAPPQTHPAGHRPDDAARRR